MKQKIYYIGKNTVNGLMKHFQMVNTITIDKTIYCRTDSKEKQNKKTTAKKKQPTLNEIMKNGKNTLFSVLFFHLH